MNTLGTYLGIAINSFLTVLKDNGIISKDFAKAEFDYKLPIIFTLIASVFMFILTAFILFI